MSVWALPKPSGKSTSLLDIMSEELAVQLQDPEEKTEEHEAAIDIVPELIIEDAVVDVGLEDIDADLALALALQELENSGYNDQPRTTTSYNKISVSTSENHQFPSLPESVSIRSSDRYDAEILGAMLCGESDIQFRNGVATLPDGRRISKHDSLLDGLGNGVSLTEIDGVGDLDNAGLMVGNSVANGLRMFRQKKQKKGIATFGRVSAKDVSSTTESVLDPSTRMIIFKLIQAGRFDNLYGVIKTGKEANVYHAVKDTTPVIENVPPSTALASTSSSSASSASALASAAETTATVPLFSVDDIGREEDNESEVNVQVELDKQSLVEEGSLVGSGQWGEERQFAVKVFKTTLNEFSNRADYVDGDHRYYGKKFSKAPKRSAIHQWTEKEFRNLCRARNAGLSVPRPIFYRENVLVMELIGDLKDMSDTVPLAEGEVGRGPERILEPSPQLREAVSQVHDEDVWRDVYLQTLELVHNLYQKCRLVHADLSAYNLLLKEGRQVVAIDFGQAVDISHPEHLQYLRRDVSTISEFFEKLIGHVLSVDDVIDMVTKTGDKQHIKIEKSPNDKAKEVLVNTTSSRDGHDGDDVNSSSEAVPAGVVVDVKGMYKKAFYALF